MKHSLYLLLILGLATSACTLPFTVAVPTATELVLPSETPTEAGTSTPSNTPLPSDTPSVTPTASDTPLPSDTPTITPTATELPFDPSASYGTATLYDSMDTDRNWADSGGGLPDSNYLRLALGGGRLHVTGKQVNWDTWYYTWPSPTDFFVQMTVETDECSGKQAYGLILRGPQDISASNARGYIFTFSCDGSYSLVRLDDTSPYLTEELIPWTESEHINAGSNDRNVMGIQMIGEEITLYANGFEIAEIEDDTYLVGRFGIFVNADSPGNFTYNIDELSYWDLD